MNAQLERKDIRSDDCTKFVIWFDKKFQIKRMRNFEICIIQDGKIYKQVNKIFPDGNSNKITFVYKNRGRFHNGKLDIVVKFSEQNDRYVYNTYKVEIKTGKIKWKSNFREKEM